MFANRVNFFYFINFPLFPPPPPLQEQVLAEERQTWERIHRVASPPADPSHADDMDNACFLATLDRGGWGN